MRFFDVDGKDLIPRKDRIWTIRPLAQRMVSALKKADRKIPENLTLLSKGQSPKATTKQIAFAMHCFWTGEMKLGQIEGVRVTEAGWLDRREVTLVTYDPSAITEKKIRKTALALDCADRVYTDLKGYRRAKSSDQKRQIHGTPFAKLKLTPEQATKINAWVRVDQGKALKFLRPEQKRALRAQSP